MDHVLRDGVLDAAYRWVVDAAGTYTEVSPSGDGLHLYFRGGKPEGAERCRKGGVEMYDHDRFFTVTGVPYTGVREVASRPDVVEPCFSAIRPRSRASRTPGGTATTTASTTRKPALALVGEGSYLRGTAVLAMHDLALADPRSIKVATAKRIRRKLPSWVATVPAKEGDRTTYYEGIRSQRVADAIRECRQGVMRERLADAARQARDEGLITQKEYDGLEKELA